MALTNTLSDLVEKAIHFHDSINNISVKLFRQAFPKRAETPFAEAQENLEALAHRADLRMREYLKRRRVPSKKTPLSRLRTFGEYHVPLDDLTKIKKQSLWRLALTYDGKGIIPATSDTMQSYVNRANELLFLHTAMKSISLTPIIKANSSDEGGLHVHLWPENQARFALPKDISEATSRIPYGMDLTWMAVFIKPQLDYPALGLTFTLPQYNGFNFVEMLDKYKSREQYISVLAHELTHGGTVHLDTRPDYLETKAYSVGKGDMLLGEHAVSFSANPPLIQKFLTWAIETYSPLPVPEKVLKHFAKVKSFVRVLENTGSYRAVQSELTERYGARGNYIIGRLTADEIEEFRDTNDIPGRIRMKNGLKWDIIRYKLKTGTTLLESIIQPGPSAQK